MTFKELLILLIATTFCILQFLFLCVRMMLIKQSKLLKSLFIMMMMANEEFLSVLNDSHDCLCASYII